MKNLKDKKIILIGANGGIGSQLSKLLAKEEAKIILVGSNSQKLQQQSKELGNNNSFITADFSSFEGIKDAAAIISEIDKPDMLINLAGISYFGSLGLQKPEEIAKLYNINLLAPTLLTQAVLPEMIKNNCGHIVNVGSIVGSIAFPFLATYSTSKAGLRAFSESLRRELFGTEIKVTYVAPRTVKTAINSDSNIELMEKTKAAIDTPEFAALKILQAIKADKKYAYVGCAESKFVKLNYLFPSLVDMGLKKTQLIAKEILTKNS